MPNWIEGTLKLRGETENILRFFREGINVYEWSGPTLNNYAELDRSSWYTENLIRDSTIYIENVDAYIEGTTRAFVESQTVYLEQKWDGSQTFVGIRFKQAWGFETNEFLNIAKRFDIDIRAYGIESGMQFSQEFCIENGELKFDNTTKYNDWFWECPFPYMGG